MGIDDIIGKAKGVVADAAESAKEFVGNAADATKDFAGDVKEFTGDAVDKAKEVGADIRDRFDGDGDDEPAAAPTPDDTSMKTPAP